MAGAQEVVISTSGGLGEAEAGGVILDIIPRDGGNTFSGTVFANGANGAMQGSNYTQSLKDQGLKAPSELIKRVRRQSHGRRPDHPGQALVLPDLSRRSCRRTRSRACGSTRTPATRMPGRWIST